MATKGYIGAKFYNLAIYTGENKVFFLTSGDHLVLSYLEFQDEADKILSAAKDQPYIYVEPENSTRHN